MADEISEAARGKIEALLHDITAGHDIDDDARDELRSHMEEKFLDYKQCTEPISDDDAMLLVRKHFGKPEVIVAMYQETRERVTPMLFFPVVLRGGSDITSFLIRHRITIAADATIV